MPPTTLRPLTSLSFLAAAVVLTGCGGLTDPYRPIAPGPQNIQMSTVAPADGRDPAPERGGTIPKNAQSAQDKLAATAGRPSPGAALARYAAIYINWDAAHVIVTQTQLASISLGQARAQALQAAASAARDTQLTHSQVANHGEVVTIAPGQAAASGRWVLVTRELTSGQGDYAGLPPTVHVIYAQVTATNQGWVVSQWEPQN